MSVGVLLPVLWEEGKATSSLSVQGWRKRSVLLLSKELVDLSPRLMAPNSRSWSRLCKTVSGCGTGALFCPFCPMW